MDYFELRKQVSKIMPRMTTLFRETTPVGKIAKTHGRKCNYKEFELSKREWVNRTRLLNLEEIGSFLEVSCRAAACPMPLNIDVWDGLLCPFGCKYCFATAFRSYLYTAFFDNAKLMKLRHCNADKYKSEMDKLLKFRGKDPHSMSESNSIAKAICMDVPIRFGIRFEDFCGEEGKVGVSLELLNYLADNKYPLMINTKSTLVAEDRYIKALTRNPAGTAVHITLISSNDRVLKELEPGAPTFEQRINTMKLLTKAGVRVVARIEPFILFVCDEKEDVERYIKEVWNAGVRHITFDTYHYTANSPGIAQSFKNLGYDWDRIFRLGCDSQAMGSLLLGKFMELFTKKGFSCSSFDMGNVPSNSQDICCEVGDWFKGGFNWGSSVIAIRYIQHQKGKAVAWNEFKEWVMKCGGFLSKELEIILHQMWNGTGEFDAYGPVWARGLRAV